MLFVSDQDICQMDHFAQNLRGALPPLPECAPIIQIKADSDALCASLAHRLYCEICGGRAYRGCNACRVKPRSSFEDVVPRDIAWLRPRDGAVFTIVDHAAGPL